MILEVFDGQVPLGLSVLQERHRRDLGHEHCPGEVVGLHPLPEELGEVARLAVIECEMPDGLQDDRSGSDRVEVVAARDVDASVAHVGHGANRRRHVVGSEHLEPEVGGERVEVALGHGSAPVVVDRFDDVGRQSLDLGEVVAPGAHLGAELGVDGAGLVAGERRRPVAAPQLGVQPDQMLENEVGDPRRGFDVRQVEIPVGLVFLHPLDLDLEVGAA